MTMTNLSDASFESVLGWAARSADVIPEEHLDAARRAWLTFGALPSKVHVAEFEVHPPRVQGGTESKYSTSSSVLQANEWLMCTVTSAVASLHEAGAEVADADIDYEDDPDKKLTYHGTTFLSFLKIIRAGGMIPGPNGHSFRGTNFKGIFSANNLPEAFECRPRLDQGIDHLNVLHPCAMPVVLELSCGHLKRYHKHRRDVFVTPGIEGSVMPTVRIARVHFNRRRIVNFMNLADQANVRRMQVDGWNKVTCAGQCGEMCPWEEAHWYAGGWKKSRNKLPYCGKCYARFEGSDQLL